MGFWFLHLLINLASPDHLMWLFKALFLVYINFTTLWHCINYAILVCNFIYPCFPQCKYQYVHLSCLNHLFFLLHQHKTLLHTSWLVKLFINFQLLNLKFPRYLNDIICSIVLPYLQFTKHWRLCNCHQLFFVNISPNPYPFSC